MWWMWIVGPLLIALIYVLTGARDRRREAEVERWRSQAGAPIPADQPPTGYRDAKKPASDARVGAKRVASVPAPLLRMLLLAGPGPVLAHFELVPKIAFLSSVGTNAVNASDHHTVSGKLEDKAPMFTVRPLAFIEGQREVNTGVQFKKDADFMAFFFVERSIEGMAPASQSGDALDKAIRKWLSPTVRAALMDLPDAWLLVDGKAMAVSLYGRADAEKLSELVELADVIFAEHGADGGPSLLGDDSDEANKMLQAQKGAGANAAADASPGVQAAPRA